MKKTRLFTFAVALFSASALFGLTGCGEAEQLAEAVVETPVETAAAANYFTDESPDVPATLTAPQSAPSVAITDDAVTTGNALTVLDTLNVEKLVSDAAYDRVAAYGAAWLDVGDRGCDTRNETLARDLSKTSTTGCQVLSGTLDDPYTGEQLDFVQGAETSSLVQVDHLVSLQNAWQTGAQNLSRAQRESLANDPLNLQSVDGLSESIKAGRDASNWLPDNLDFRCEYIARQISVKATYGLWVTKAEKSAMATALKDCPEEPEQSSPFTPKPVPKATPTRTPTPTPEPVPEYTPSPVPEPDPVQEQPAVTGINPGGFCSTPGVVGTAANGRSYTCGGNGPDANGKYHWNK